MEPKAIHCVVLTAEEEAIVLGFRGHTLLSRDDGLYALQASIPHLTCSALHRCLQRNGISRLSTGDRALLSAAGGPTRQKFKAYSIGYFHIDIAEVRTEKGKLHF